MKQKKIVNPVPQFSLHNICSSSNSVLNEAIEKFNNSTNFTVQQECIKTFGNFLKNYYKVDQHECALKVMAIIYVSCTAKHPLKKTLTRMLLPFQKSDLLSKYLSESIKNHLEIVNGKDQENAIPSKDEFFNSLYTSFDVNAFTTAVLENADCLFNLAVDFLQELVNILWKRSFQQISFDQDLLVYIYNTTKFLLCFLQKCITGNLDTEHVLKLINSLYEITIHKAITFEVKCNCGHMMTLLFSNLPLDLVKDAIVPDRPYLDFLLFEEKDTVMLLKIGIKKIEDEEMFEMFQICVFIGISIVAPADVLYKQKIDDKIVLSFMVEKLIHSATNTKQNVHQMMGVSKALAMLSSHLQYIDVEIIGNLSNEYLNYLNIYMDNVPDVVKNNSETIFKNVIKVATIKGYDLMKTIMDWFQNLSGSSTFYTVMVILGSEIGCDVILEKNPNLVKQMLSNLTNPKKAANVLNTVEKLMQIHRKDVQSKNEWFEYWVKEILAHLQNSKEPQLFIDLFVTAFKIEPDSLTILTTKGTFETDFELLALLGCIHFARKTGLTLDSSQYLNISNECWRKLMDYNMFDVLKTYLNDEIRILALGIIVDSHSSIEMFTEWELNYLIDYLYYNINVPNANFRQRLVSYAKKTMQRLHDTTNNIQNKIETAKKCEQIELKHKLLENINSVSLPILNYYSKFWRFLFSNILLPGLYLDSNYLRKSTSLEVLILSNTFLPKSEFIRLWSNEDIDNLKHIVDYDTYEQNKEAATKLLVEFPPNRLNFHTKKNLSLYVDKCLSLALNIKPIQTISAAYMLNVCLRIPDVHDVILEKLQKTDFKLYDTINKDKNCLNDASYLMLLLLNAELWVCLNIAQQNIHEAAASKPIHGLIFCIRHIMTNTNLNQKSKLPHWKLFCENLINLCLELTIIVNTIVCNDSPEGYLPDNVETDVNEVDGTARAQMITVYGWRATKEISLLFGELSLNAPFWYSENCEGLIDAKQAMTIGKYFFDLLINTKHRGAFEQASIGFCNLCTRLWRLLDTPVNTLPLQWLGTISSLLLGTHSESIKSCETRRSAGIPFMVQAILSTKPISASSTKTFDSFMKTLLSVGNNETYAAEQRILALNILRALYRHNRLGEMVIPYCAQGIIIAVKGFGCPVWGIRNSATLLFSALIMRIFGVQRLRDTVEVSIKNKMQGQVFFVRYPELFSFLLQELETASKEKYHSSLYPVLLILSRLYCNKEALDRSQLDVFLPYVELCLNNPSFKIRDLAAQTIPALTEPSKLIQVTMRCIVNLSDKSLPNNCCHGLLLQLQHLLRLQDDTLSVLNIDKIVNDTLWILELCGYKIDPITATFYLEIVFYLITRYDPKFANANVICKIMEVLLCQEQYWNFQPSSLKKYNECVFNLKLVNMLHIKTYQPELCTAECLIYTNIINEDLKNRSGILNLCLCYINYIEFTSPCLKFFNLFEEDFEYSELCNQFLKPLDCDSRLFLYKVLFNLVVATVTEDVRSYSYAIDTLLLHKLPKRTMDCMGQFLSEKNKKYIRNYGGNYECLVVAHLHRLFYELNDSELGNLSFSQYMRVLLRFSSPTSNSYTRLAVAKLLAHNKRLFYNTFQILSLNYVCALWEVVFALLEDDDEDVRKTICLLCKDDSKNADSLVFVSSVRIDIPEYSRKKLLKQMCRVLPRNDSIKILLSQIFRTNAVTNDNLSEVFEEGSLNAYVELWPMAKTAIEELRCMFHSDVENRTETSVEHTLFIVNDLYNVLCQNCMPMVPLPIKDLLCSIFQEVIEQKEDLKSVIINTLTTSNKLDVYETNRLKTFLNEVFVTNFGC